MRFEFAFFFILQITLISAVVGGADPRLADVRKRLFPCFKKNYKNSNFSVARMKKKTIGGVEI